VILVEAALRCPGIQGGVSSQYCGGWSQPEQPKALGLL
jgi:hypothetical protein